MYIRHGESKASSRAPEYRAWNGMIQRCTNPKNPNYHRYGGRGISVCDRWRNYALFLDDVGRRPSDKYSLDRFPDNNGNYEPGNVRWATREQQARNQRTSSRVLVGGRILSIPDIKEITGIKAGTLKTRITILGWTGDEAATIPVQSKVRTITAFGQTKPVNEWAAEMNLKPGTIHGRLRRGRSPELAVSPELGPGRYTSTKKERV